VDDESEHEQEREEPDKSSARIEEEPDSIHVRLLN
jgi:hypothetical protein